MGSMFELPRTIRDLRVQVATGAARAEHVFVRTLTAGEGPMPPVEVERNLTAHFGAFHGFALAAVLQIVEARGDAELAAEVLATVNDVGANGDDGRSADVWADVEARLAGGGVGTPAWDKRNPVVGVTVRQEWGVWSTDGTVYSVDPSTEEKAVYEATLLYRGDPADPGEPGCAPAHRYVMTLPRPAGVPREVASGWSRPMSWTPPAAPAPEPATEPAPGAATVDAGAEVAGA